ncbi:MAG: endopeptidase La [Cystobacterineae bacterium]|nr:endopeptidase La [Cystobacterineae bacterium]
MSQEQELLSLPLLPLRDIVVFPRSVTVLYVGREKSIAALSMAWQRGEEGKARIILSAQKKAKTNDPTEDEVFQIGTVAQILQLIPMPDGTMKALVEGLGRCRILHFLEGENYFEVKYEPLLEEEKVGVEIEALMRSVHATFESFVKLNKRIPPDVPQKVKSIQEVSALADTIVGQLSIKLADKQGLLEILNPTSRLERVLELMQGEIEILQVEKKIRTRVKKQMEKSQKDYYLNEQMQAIRRELGEKDEEKSEAEELEERLNKTGLNPEAREKMHRELKKFSLMGPMSAEAGVLRNYIDWVLALPWQQETTDNVDIALAEDILNEDHHGLEQTKERILDHLAVQTLAGKMRGPILCLVGPPGVGKTSLGHSIARALSRKFVRISLGGVRDEAEIRGHRRTYVGAMPGKIIQAMKKAQSNNPVVLLDEIDKMSSDFRGDPSSALLEVLDPEQNEAFNDHYLELDYDLSRALFVCTANNAHAIPGPLLDRMELIRIAGYTDEEKMAILKKHLLPRQQEANGLSKVDIRFEDAALKTLIHGYTREAGVRSLEREIARVFRKLARLVLQEGTKPHQLGSKRLRELLGPQKFSKIRRESLNQIGIVAGLAVMESGGDVLLTEAATMPGKGKLIITGHLGEVMQESAQAAMTYVRARARRFGMDEKFLEHADMHIHVPEGAIPKDGPSAGVTLVTAMLSALTRIPVRSDLAMTGEITLRGRVLSVGGVKEKILAAHRAGIRLVCIPKSNRKALEELPHYVRKSMKFYPVEYVDEVLRVALVSEKNVARFEPMDARGLWASMEARELSPPIPH